MVEIGQFEAGGQFTFSYLATLGSQWTFEGSGDYLGEGHDQFLLESTAGQVLLGDINSAGVLHLTQVSDLPSQWTLHG